MTEAFEHSDPDVEDRDARESRARAGDADALAALLAEFRNDAVRLCYRYVGNVHEAEDAAQDALLGLADPSTWPETGLRARVFRLARCRSLDLIRRRQGDRAGGGTHFKPSRYPSPRTGPGTALARQERQEALRISLSALSSEQAEVLSLRYLDGLSRSEVAEVLELPESVVKSRIYEGMQTLRARMRERTE